MFEDKFSQEYSHGDVWSLEVLRINPKNKHNWTHFSMVRDDASYECEVRRTVKYFWVFIYQVSSIMQECGGKQWGSAWAWVSVWYRYNRMMKKGDVTLRIFGQKCKNCIPSNGEKMASYTN